MRIEFFDKMPLKLLRDFIDQCHDDKDYGIDFELACCSYNSRLTVHYNYSMRQDVFNHTNYDFDLIKNKVTK